MIALREELKDKTRGVHESLHSHPLLVPLLSKDINTNQYYETLISFYCFYRALHKKLSLLGHVSDVLVSDIDRLKQDIAFLNQEFFYIPNATLSIDMLTDWSTPNI